MKLFVVNLTDVEGGVTRLVGVFSSYNKAWEGALEDKKKVLDPMGVEISNQSSRENRKHGRGHIHIVFSNNTSFDPYFIYNISPVEMDMFIPKHEQDEVNC
jgi:hypothetical protein